MTEQPRAWSEEDKENIPPSNMLTRARKRRQEEQKRRIKSDPLQSLPDNCLEITLLFLDMPDILQVAATCHTGLKICKFTLENVIYQATQPWKAAEPQVFQLANHMHYTTLSFLDKAYKTEVYGREIYQQYSLIDQSRLMKWLMADMPHISGGQVSQYIGRLMPKRALGDRFWDTMCYQTIEANLKMAEHRNTKLKEFFLGRIMQKAPVVAHIRNTWYFHPVLEKVFSALFWRHCSHCRKIIKEQEEHFQVCVDCLKINRDGSISDIPGGHFFTSICSECETRNRLAVGAGEDELVEEFQLAHCLRFPCPLGNPECEEDPHNSQHCDCDCHCH